jgi:hypothetical protein
VVRGCVPAEAGQDDVRVGSAPVPLSDPRIARLVVRSLGCASFGLLVVR